MSTKTEKISDSVAIKAVAAFLSIHSLTPIKESDVKEENPLLVQAYKNGNLILEGEEPIYKLTQPLKGEESNEVLLDQVKFKTRIKPSQLANLSRGLNLSKDSFQYALACTAFIISQPKGYLDKFNKLDYTVIQQLSANFL